MSCRLTVRRYTDDRIFVKRWSPCDHKGWKPHGNHCGWYDTHGARRMSKAYDRHIMYTDTCRNGVFAVVCILLISNGIKIIQSEPLDERSSLIVGISVVAAVATIVIPTDVVNAMPQFLNYFMSSGTAVGATIAVVLQLCLPRKKKAVKVALEG